jgi:hypothetical protein
VLTEVIKQVNVMAFDYHRQSSPHFVHKYLMPQLLRCPNFVKMARPLNCDAATGSHDLIRRLMLRA